MANDEIELTFAGVATIPSEAAKELALTVGQTVT
jgi:hypothetical protein